MNIFVFKSRDVFSSRFFELNLWTEYTFPIDKARNWNWVASIQGCIERRVVTYNFWKSIDNALEF